MNKMFKRIILEDIDYFNYLDPNCFKKKDSKEDEEKDEKILRPECKNDSERKSDEEASDEELKKIFKGAKNTTDLRRFLQYSNAANE